MSAQFSRKFLWLVCLLALVCLPHAAQAAEAVTAPVFPTSGATITADYQQDVTVMVTGVAASTTVTLSLVDSVTHNPIVGGVTATGGLTRLDSVSGSSSVTFANVQVTTPSAAGSFYLLQVKTSTSPAAFSATPFTVTPGAPATVVISSGPTPSTSAAGSAFALSVNVKDGEGNEVSPNTPVTLALTNSDGSAVSSGTTLTGGSANTSGTTGVAAFSISINKTGPYKVKATSGGIPSLPSGTITINPGPAAQLAFLQQPTNGMAGVSLSPAVTVQIEDANGNLTSATSVVTIALGNNPGGSTLGGTLTPHAVAGTATFSDLTLNRPGNGYTLTAAAAGLSGATSNGFNIAAGTPAQLVFGQQPTNAVAGTSLSAATVQIEDADGNLTGAASQVTVALGNNPGSSTLGGAVTVGAVNGVATFSNLTLNKIGNGYTLTAAAAGLSNATSSGFNITIGATSVISFTQQPTSGTPAGAPFPSDVKVAVSDASGNPVVGTSVSLSLVPSTTPATTYTAQMTGDGTGGTTAGVALFPGISVSPAGTYQLKATATSSGISINSDIFTVTAGAANQLVFSQPPPASVLSGAPFTVTVQAEDGTGSVDTTYAHLVTLQLVTFPAGATLVTLSGPPVSRSTSVTVLAHNGIATFPNLTPNLVGSYTVQATDGTFTTATPNPAFAVTPGAATSIALPLPSPAAGLTTDSTFNLTATVTDGQGNRVTDGTLVTLAISSGGGPGIVLTGGTANTVGGVATFSVNINKAGTYKFKAASGGISSAETGPLTISAGAVAALTFTRQPGSTGAGLPITPSVTVLAKDASGNVVPGAAIIMSLAGTSSAGTAATLGGTATQTTDSTGTATFAGLTVSQIGPAYTLIAASGATVNVTSSPFAVTAGPAASIVLGLSNPPTPITTDTFFTVTAAVRDSQGFPVVDGTVVSLGLTNSDSTAVSSGITLQGGTSSTAGGVAIFSININTIGSYLITAASGTAHLAAPLPVTISAGAVATLTFLQEPTSTAAGAAITPAVTVQAKDAGGNVVPNAGVSLTLSGTPTTGGTAVLGGTATQTTDTTGVATFANLSISKVGTAYTLTASAGSAPAVASSSFAITPGQITLAFTAQPPASTVSGTPFAVSVSLLDGSGNPVPNAPVTLSLSQGAGTLTANATQNTDAAGHATFSGLSIDKAGPDKQLMATATVTTGTTTQTYTAATAPDFAITPGAVATLSFSSQPPATVGDPTVPFAVVVQALDAGQNPVANSPTTTVTLTLSGSGAAKLNGGITQSTLSGAATFPGLTVSAATFPGLTVSAPGTYQITAAAQTTGANASATPVVSTSFTVGNLPGAITLLTTDVGIVHAGNPAFTLTISGTSFVPGAVVTFNGASSVLSSPTATPLVTNVTVSSDGTQITATIAASLVAKADNPLVTVTNPGTDPARAGKLNFLVYPLGPVADTTGTMHTPQTAQYFNPGLQFFSVPFDYKADAAGNPLPAGDVLRFFDVNPIALTITDLNMSPTLAVWDPMTNGYVLTTGDAVPVFQPDGVTADSLVLGQGYWGRFQFHPAADPTRQAGLSVLGLTASALTDSRKLSGQTFAITLQQGWNMIGDPFTGAVNLSLIQVQTLDTKGNASGQTLSLSQASDSGVVSDLFYKYVGGTGYVPVTPAGVLLPGGAPAASDNNLNPYVGYWAFSYQPCHLLVPAP